MNKSEAKMTKKMYNHLSQKKYKGHGDEYFLKENELCEKSMEEAVDNLMDRDNEIMWAVEYDILV